VQADGRFIEDVEHAAKVGSQLRREPDPLAFPAAQGLRGAIQLQVTEPNLLHEAEPLHDLGKDVPGDARLFAFEPERPDQRSCLRHAETGDFVDRASQHLDVLRNEVEPRAVAIPAGLHFLRFALEMEPFLAQFRFQHRFRVAVGERVGRGEGPDPSRGQPGHQPCGEL